MQGHVDPGYHGPIVIRLINIRSEPWVLRMGTPIFTIVFQTLNQQAAERRPPISDKDMLELVEASASNSMNNALYDLYAKEVDKRLLDHQSTVEARLRQVMAEQFIQRNEFWSIFFKNIIARIVTLIVAGMIVGGFVIGVLSYFGVSPGTGSDGETRNGSEDSTSTGRATDASLGRTVDR